MEKPLPVIGETGHAIEEVRRLFPQLNHQLLTFNEMRKELLKQMPGRPMDEKMVEWMVFFWEHNCSPPPGNLAIGMPPDSTNQLPPIIIPNEVGSPPDPNEKETVNWDNQKVID